MKNTLQIIFKGKTFKLFVIFYLQTYENHERILSSLNETRSM